MSKTPLLTFRCPQDLIDAIQLQMQHTGLNKTDVAVSRLKNSVPSMPILDRAKLPKIPAIYFVITSYNKLLYIGRTENLFNRWGSHHRYQQFIETDSQSRIAWFEIEENNLESMPIVEDELITLLDTEYNNSKVVNGRFKATININRESWDKFKSLCLERGTTATEEIGNFIDLFVLEKTTTGTEFLEYDNYPQSIQTVYDVLEGRSAMYIERITDNLKARLDKVEKRLDGLETDGLETETPKTDLSSISERLTEIKLAEQPEENYFPEEKTYTDKEVAQAEGKTRETIRRYRKDERKPKDSTFWQRWKPTENKEAWLEKNA